MITGNEPINGIIVEGNTHSMDKYQGLTIRQYYAGLAMQGIMSSWNRTSMPETKGVELAVKASVEIADALISELNKPQP